MNVIQLTPSVYETIIQHAHSDLPAEAVGLLGGPRLGYATYSVALPNRLGQKTFWADPFAQFKAERQLLQLGLQLVAVYHSHPHGGSQLSSLDVLFARKRTCLQIVIALARAHLPGVEMRAYRIVQDNAIEVEVRVKE